MASLTASISHTMSASLRHTMGEVAEAGVDLSGAFVNPDNTDQYFVNPDNTDQYFVNPDA